MYLFVLVGGLFCLTGSGLLIMAGFSIDAAGSCAGMEIWLWPCCWSEAEKEWVELKLNSQLAPGEISCSKNTLGPSIGAE